MLVLHFDQRSHEFDEPSSSDAPIAKTVKHLLKEVVGVGHGYNIRNGFNDLGFYTDLCNRYGRDNIEGDAIQVEHNAMFSRGMQVIYRRTLREGQDQRNHTTRIWGPLHKFVRRGYYHYYRALVNDQHPRGSSTSYNWEIVGHVILLRSLVEKNRASTVQNMKYNEAVIQSFIVDTGEDVFRRVLSFLAWDSCVLVDSPLVGILSNSLEIHKEESPLNLL